MKKSKTLLGIDIGTSGLKASLFDLSGNMLATAYRPSVYLPLPAGHMEQEAKGWWGNLCSVLSEIFSRTDVTADCVAGIGICGFHHCPVFLKEDGQPARPVMLLHDERLPKRRAKLEQTGILAQVEGLTESMVSAGHFPPIFHYIAGNDPEGLKRTRWIVLAKDYLRFELTSSIGTEVCDATGLNLIEPKQSEWSKQLCQLLSVPIEILPSIANPADIAGYVTRTAAEQTGLVVGTPVVYGGGDSHCALLGLGCIQNGDTGLLLGTNSTLRTVFDDFVSHPQIRMWVQHHVVPNHYTVSASSMAGASVLGWFRQNFIHNKQGNNEDSQMLENSVAGSPIGSDKLVFLPYIYGERCPFYAPDASGAFLGIKHWHKVGHFLRSIMEGVALNIANCFDLIQDCCKLHNTTVEHLRLGGGGSKTTLWHQIISDSLNQPIRIMNTEEAGTLGAALLAGIGTGIYTDYRQAVDEAVRVRRIIEPNSKNHIIYLELKNKLNDLYGRIQ